MNKKILLVICCLILSLAVLSGCSLTDTNQEITYKIEVDDTIEHGQIIPSKSESTKGKSITIEVLPEEGYRLKEGSLSGSNTNVEDCSFIMPGNNVMLFAEFEQVFNITVDDNISGGTITISSDQATEGETITATATPEQGYRLKDNIITFGNFEKPINNNSQASFDVYFDIMVSAVFELIPETLKITGLQLTATQPGSTTTRFALDDIIISLDSLRELPILSYSSGQIDEGGGHIFYDKDEGITQSLTLNCDAYLLQDHNFFEDGQELELHFHAQFYESLTSGPTANGATASRFQVLPSVGDEIIVKVEDKIFNSSTSRAIIIEAIITFEKI